MVVCCVIRHFKTLKGTEQINYSNSFEEAEPYINYLKKLISTNNIENIKIKSSPQDRALLTSLILFIKLNEISSRKSVKIYKPEIEKFLNRDPKKKNTDTIKQYFNNYISSKLKNDNKTLIIYITHSSVYHTIFKSIVEGFNIKKNKDIKKEHIHGNSLSYIEYNDDKNFKLKFNIPMGKDDHAKYNS